jgi:hypothetical protein
MGISSQLPRAKTWEDQCGTKTDATKTGDSFYTNELVDNVLVSRDGFCDDAT